MNDRVAADHRPDPLGVLDTLEAAAWQANDPAFVAALAQVCSVQFGLSPIAAADHPTVPFDGPGWRVATDLDESWRVAFAFAEQFVVDVTGITDSDRAALGAAFGARTGEVVFLIYVADMVPRVSSALAQLGAAPLSGAAPLATTADMPSRPDGLWPAIDEFIRVVARMDRLDPVTSELVRLRGARQHHCRMCMSLRNRTAMLAGADDEMFAAVDTFRDGDPAAELSARHIAALELTDALIWTPARIEATTIAAVRSEFDGAEQVELVLDVMRNAANKIAVALAADAANVEDGYEIYDIGSDGDPVYGLSLA